MIIFVACALVLVVAALVFRSRLLRLGQLRLRGLRWGVLALAVQVLVISVLPDDHPGLLAAAHVSTYMVAGWVVWLNRRVVGLPVVGLGGALNAAAITANGGVMPASAAAVAASGRAIPEGHFANSAPVASPRLAWLGDVFATPSSWWVHNVFSIGDVLTVSGFAILVVGACLAPPVVSAPDSLSQGASRAAATAGARESDAVRAEAAPVAGDASTTSVS
ncbi:MAG: DUF5317 family protein [Actinomycetes bacterium]